MTIKERLNEIKGLVEGRHLDAAAEKLLDLAFDYSKYEAVETIISSNELTEKVEGLVSKGWQAVYITLKNIENSSKDYYYLDGYGQVRDLSFEDLEIITDKLEDALADQLEEEASAWEDEDLIEA